MPSPLIQSRSLLSTDKHIQNKLQVSIGQLTYQQIQQIVINNLILHLIGNGHFAKFILFYVKGYSYKMFGGIIGGNNVSQMRPGQRNAPPAARGNFFRELKVYPASFADRQDINKGDKVLLPASALNQLSFMIISRNKDPMIFCIKNNSKMTYCGVLEFVAEEGLCYIPEWMFKMLKFQEPGAYATIALVQDMKKQHGNVRHMIKLQPHQTKFIQIENPKAILEYQLRNFTCLHEGDTISIQIDILEINPKNQYNAVCIIDADVNVDFAAPLDYVQPEFVPRREQTKSEAKIGSVFGGNGVRIDQKFKQEGQKKVRQTVQVQKEFDPRKHRIQRGVRKILTEWNGDGIKISDAVGTKGCKK